MSKKIIVTGGAGFIGSHTVVELHQAGYTPIIIDTFENSEKSVLNGLKNIITQEVIFYEKDCNDLKALQEIFETEKSIEGVIHFVAYKAVGESVEKPLKYYKNNLGSLINILEVMEEFSVKNFVFSSSCTVYGQPEKLPVSEQAPILPAESPYGNTKQISEEIIQDYIKGNTIKKTKVLSAVILRYFNPIGSHPSAEIGELPIGKPNNLVPFITQTAAGLREKLSVFGNDYNTPDGTCIRDYIHVVDLAKAHVKAIKFLENSEKENFAEIVNLGTGRGNTVLEVLNTFEEVNQLKLNYEIGKRREGDIEQVYAVAEKAAKVLNWKAEKSLADALKDAWAWQKKILKNN